MGAKKKAGDGDVGVDDATFATMEQEIVDQVLQQDVEEFVENATVKACKQLYEEYLDNQEVPFAVDQAMGKLAKVIDLAFLFADRGEQEEDLDSIGWSLHKFAVPERSTIDTWSRGAIPVRKKKVKQHGESFLGALPGGMEAVSKLPSESGRSKTKSVSSRLRGNNNGRIGTSGTEASQRKRGKLPDYIVRLTDDDEGGSRPNSRNSGGRRGSVESEYEARVRALKEIEEKKKAADLARQKRQDEEKQESIRAETLAKELKGKDFSLDEDGQITIIQHVHGDKLPKTTYEIPHEVTEVVPSEEEEKCSDSKSVGGESASSNNKKKKDKKKEDSKKAANAHYRSAESFQQSVLKNPALELQPGVSIRENGSGKSGPALEDDDKHMTRENFMLHQSMLESQYLEPSSTHEEEKKQPEESENDKQQPSKQPAKAPEPMEDIETNEATHDGGNGYLGGNVTMIQTREEEGEAFVDPNLEILNNPSWGQNRPLKEFIPAVLPSTSSDLNGGNSMFMMGEKSPNPRKRISIETNNINNSKHTVPPSVHSPLSPIPKETKYEEPPYDRKFHSVNSSGKINVESDRAYRILGLAYES